jgi:signal transduction histidine kinase
MFKKNISIRTKIIMTPILLMGIVSIAIYTYYPSQQRREARISIESKIKDIRNLLSVGVGIGMGETDLVAISEAMDWVTNDSSFVYVSVLDKRNKEIALFNRHNLQIQQSEISYIPYDKIYESNHILYCRTKIIYQKYFLGTIYVGYSLDEMDNKISKLKTTTLFFSLILFTLGGLISLFVSNRITNNVRKLNDAVNLITEGNLDVNVEVKGEDEIGKLSKAFNQMVYNQKKSREELVERSSQLEKQNQELNQFSYVVSHDLKAPLQAIFKLSEWIEEDLGAAAGEPVRKNLEILRGRVLRLESLINGLLEYSKIGRINIVSEKVDVEIMLSNIVNLFNLPPSFKINIRTGKLVFQTKMILLQQVFFNLISNAIKYNDKEFGEINITVKTIDRFYEFTVEDNGVGIAPMYHKKIFVIFQMLEARDKVEGTGVGLAIIKKSVEDMGGTIGLTSEVGIGSKFSFTWPSSVV